MFELNNFESIKIALASPEKIRQWSKGEVKKPETINYRTLKPEKDGLFCERIFGPTKDWECHCGKYRRVRYKGVVCDRCGVEVTKSKVRRERMGHIELAAPVSHIWYFKGIPSRMGLLLDMSPRSLEKVLYFASYIVIDSGETGLTEKQLLTEKEYRDALEKYGNTFKAGMGAEAIKELLNKIDLDSLSKELKLKLKDSTGQKRVRTIRRMEVVEAFKQSDNKPDWMILDVIPVIPPDLRPMVQLDGGRFATSDLNDLYRRVINRNNRLKRLLDLGAPDIIVRNEKRMLQEAVDALIDNGRRGRPVTGPGNRPLKSLSDMLKGKQGRFRQNLLGKRVDYSGRSVIVVGPELKFYQCGLPKKMALELFKPFVMNELVSKGYAHNIKSAKRMVEKVKSEVWDVLEDVIKGHPVLLNRAPTLHRLGIQAFEPTLVEGKAIKLHPLVCSAYNADFDGDQMAVHVPLSVEAQAEARFLMLSTNNILAPKDGSPITTPTQDMVLGSYYLTIEVEGEKGEGSIFKDYNEMLLAYQTGSVGLHAKVKVRKKLSSQDKGELVESTVGRFIFNENIPQDLGFVDRTKDKYSLEVDFLVDKKQLGKIIDKCFRKHGNTITAIMLDNIKSLGFTFSTKGAVTISIADMDIPKEKYELISKAEERVEKYERAYRRGLISDEERYEKVIETWTETTERVTDALMSNLGRLNNVFIMAHSGARGSKNQIRQLGGMRGLMANASGKTVEIPVKSNFREGLTVLEYFTSSHGARKGLADTALRTADSGYLTRRLVDVSQDVIVREVDCGTKEGVIVAAFKDGNEVIEELYDRIVGRYTLDDVLHPETKEIIVKADSRIEEDDAQKIIDAGIEKVKIRSVLNCKTSHGVCSKCYGRNLATGKEVNIGEAVGIIAAQSIGEPGTQLTMRTFHTGGVAGGDITQGLPRVEELFEARKPKGLAIITEVSGKVELDETGKKKEITIIPELGDAKTYTIPYGSRIKVKQGQYIEAGDPITEGSINPHDILRVKGVLGVQDYIVKEVQRVYRMQGVDINDKHVEVIVRQMLSKVKVEDPGDTDLLPGGLVDILEFNEANENAVKKGEKPAVAKRVLLGITKASLATESFLSAASFQETTRVLTEAAIKGKEDNLIGLKENVIIGKLIPAGTGMKRYKNIAVEKVEE
ncbi:DNA-directed RNA polymerase subunit beta' [Tepidibacter formicigenes]|uniref:DNA-directed RNA polymerase subunit beta' n=1 Tax=Tepidibacter formicigenes DSM 15518 TaxID=1123349 RepID=A0A1M6RSA1_9FIRM|nr:DNA-directed RNA polymerase subunit beta' [Tepidibacter formicigenes]SHK35306.1 DNA-directed RNA polymerase subunit beta' [Tepidibacter formicigenes DSM 15518]